MKAKIKGTIEEKIRRARFEAAEQLQHGREMNAALGYLTVECLTALGTDRLNGDLVCGIQTLGWQVEEKLSQALQFFSPDRLETVPRVNLFDLGTAGYGVRGLLYLLATALQNELAGNKRDDAIVCGLGQLAHASWKALEQAQGSHREERHALRQLLQRLANEETVDEKDLEAVGIRKGGAR